MSEPNKNPWLKTVSAVFIGVLIGFSGATTTMISTVSAHGIEINNLKENILSDRKRTDERIYQLRELVSDVLKQNTQLVAALEVQSKLLERAYHNPGKP